MLFHFLKKQYIMFLEIEIIHKQDKANKQKEKCNSLLAVPHPEVTDCC